ncbi:MAG: hypothetical protein JWR02_1251 [Mucilaginibacter sp.]|nr:hypothetical protein [Mucilaginibacter sp.]
MNKLSVTAFLLIICFFAFGQQPTTNLLPVRPTSPDAAILGKFGNIPVGYSTGIPNISIPIYEIKIGKITVPISLDYHAGGVKVNDIPSSVGLGWALNAGGILSRNMIGRPDEDGGYLSAPAETDILNNPGTYYQYLYNPNSDFEPDNFSYSIPGQSGKFVFNKDQSVFQIPLTDNKIQFINNSQSSFQITDANGIVYVFDLPETVTDLGVPITYISSWRLSKIIDQNQNDIVTFNYDLGTGGEFLHDDVASFINTPNNSSGYGFSATNTLLSTNTTSISHPTERFLSSIVWRGGKVTFVNATDRLDRSGEKRVSEIDVYADVNGTLQAIKTVKLNQSYFINNSTRSLQYPYSDNDERNYRLRLDAVGFFPPNGAAGSPYYYTMTYDPTLMTSRESTGQDMWGFNNGQFNNLSLLATQYVTDYLQTTYAVGNANRAPDAAYMNACNIQSIQYPTGGKSVFVMEPHQYMDPSTLISNGLSCGVVGGNGLTSYSTTFTCQGYVNIYYTYSFSSFNYTTQIPQPSITITDQATGGQQVLYSPNHLQAYSSPKIYLNTYSSNNLYFIPGHTYTITANISSNTSPDGAVFASLNLNWQQYDNSQVAKIGGGLRVKSITNYDGNGAFINEDLYKYGISAEEGYGQLMTYPFLLGTTSTLIRNRLAEVGHYNDAPPSYIYHSNTLSSFTQISGSPVLYPKVSKYQLSSSGGQANGKVIYSYNLVQDTVAALIDVGPVMISNDWKNNFLYDELTLKSVNGGTSFAVVTEKNYTYTTDLQIFKTQLKILKNFRIVSGSGETQTPSSVTAYMSQTYGSLQDFTFTSYPYPSGVVRLHTATTTNQLDNGQTLVSTENYFYDDNTHLLPTRIQTTSSKNEVLTDVLKYAHDFAAPGNVYQTMLNRNIKAPVIQVQKKTNSTQESLITANYTDWFANTAILVPASVDQQILANPTETRVTFNKYDSYGNLLQQQKTGGAYQSYQWGYNKQYPVAQVTNAPANDIFYEGFEEGGGNGFYNDSKSGRHSYNGSGTPYSRTLSGLDNGSYRLSYWVKSGSTWTQQSSVVTVSGGTYPIGPIYGQVDDIRFYPVTAQMTTYTYDPLIGMTSMMDAKGQVTYYEYDDFQRLRIIKNNDGNIVKAFCYNYAGQQTNCMVPQADQPQIVYAQINVNNYNYTPGNPDAETGDVYVMFYKDPACTIPFTLTQGMTVAVQETYETYDDVNGTYYTPYYNYYTVSAGASSYYLGNITLSSNSSYYDYYGNYHYSSYNWSYSMMSGPNGDYIPE